MSDKKLTIVERVLALLNITEEGKINNFFMKQRNILNKDIKNLNKNLDTLKDSHEERLEELNEKLQDAEVVVEESYTSIKVEDIATNEAANHFSDAYWRRIEQAEYQVFRLKAEIKNTKEAHEKSVEAVKEQITERKRRLEKIS